MARRSSNDDNSDLWILIGGITAAALAIIALASTSKPPAKPALYRCYQCNQVVQEGVQFCSNCGAPFSWGKNGSAA